MLAMKPDFGELDRRVAEARVVLSLLAILFLYIDPSLGGLFHLENRLLATLLCHLSYSVLTYFALSYRVGTNPLWKLCAGLDLLFATAIAFLTEGRTSPSFVFFVFAIVAVGFRTGFRVTMLVTISSVALYISVVALSDGLMNIYMMRAAYLAIAGYLIGFFGQQRVTFETRLRELEAEAEREGIARSLHDGYIQALAGISLRLESCRDMLICNQPAEALAEIKEIQIVVAREYDDVREYVRTLASTDRQITGQTFAKLNTQFRVHASFTAAGPLVEHIIQIILEGIRNTQRHGHADSAAIDVEQVGSHIRITIDDDGVGFGDSAKPPWTISSRVAEFGGQLAIRSDAPGAHLEIAIPIE
jgi:signal transduction histidine kinase